jgi:surface antigen
MPNVLKTRANRQKTARRENRKLRIENLETRAMMSASSLLHAIPVTMPLADPWSPSAAQVALPTTTTVASSAATASVAPAVTATPAATFTSKSVSDHSVVNAGASFTQSFVFTNSGNTTWTGYTLVLVTAGDHLGAPASIAIPTTAPGATVTVTVPLQAVKTYANEGASQLAFWEVRNGSTVVPISGTSYTNSNGMAKNRVWTAITINPTSGPYLPNLAATEYTSSMNVYVPEGNGGECVAYVWGRADELLGIKLPWQANAGQPWITAAKKAGYKVDMTPTSNSIAVWVNTVTGIGHVAYVENVVTGATASTTSVTISEANFTSYLDFADSNDPNNASNTRALVPRWGGGYDGVKTLTQTQMLTHTIRNLKLLGYIHLR